MDIFSSPASKKSVIIQSFGSKEEKGLQRTARVQTHTMQTDIMFLRHHPQTGRRKKPPTFNCLQSRYGCPDWGFWQSQSQIAKNFLGFGCCENCKTYHLLKQRKIILLYFRTMGLVFSCANRTEIKHFHTKFWESSGNFLTNLCSISRVHNTSQYGILVFVHGLGHSHVTAIQFLFSYWRLITRKC